MCGLTLHDISVIEGNGRPCWTALESLSSDLSLWFSLKAMSDYAFKAMENLELICFPLGPKDSLTRAGSLNITKAIAS